MNEPQQYEIVLITPSGIFTEVYNTSLYSLEVFQQMMIDKHKEFIMQSSNPIN